VFKSVLLAGVTAVLILIMLVFTRESPPTLDGLRLRWPTIHKKDEIVVRSRRQPSSENRTKIRLQIIFFFVKLATSNVTQLILPSSYTVMHVFYGFYVLSVFTSCIGWGIIKFFIEQVIIKF
jgi:hypothetical protein